MARQANGKVDPMDLEDLIEARIAGDTVPPDGDLPDDWQQALSAHDALVHALGETIIVPDAAASRRSPPQLPADYTVLREIGHGGMGVVYLAEQHSLGRQIAVKVLRPGELVFGPLVRRFLDEARHLARLRHPNIVSIHEVGTAGSEPYFTMDYIDGRSLGDVLSEGPLAPTQAVAILKQAATAVAHAHAQGIIHRDLKPGNLLLTEPTADGSVRVLVSDFGLARDISADSAVTASGAIMGTPAYMAPEQARGQSQLIGETTDVHALGVVLYEMLSGRTPYGNDSAADVLSRLLNQEPAPLRQIDRRIPHDLETICLKAMEKSPDRRYSSVQGLLWDLERWERGESIVARRANPIKRAARFFRRQWKIAAAVAITAAILLALAPFLFDYSADALIRWGQEEYTAGQPEEAVRLFHRAALVSSGAKRRQALELMLNSAREAANTKGILDAALMIIQDDPDASFGKYDFLVAQAVVGQVRAKNPNHVIRWTPEEHDPLVRLAERRLQIFLGSETGTAEERGEAQQLLTQVQEELRNAPLRLDASAPEDQGPQLPQGAPEELLVTAGDESQLPWQRGLAALAASRQWEQSGNAVAAADAYELAVSQMRRVYPVYEGIGNVMMTGGEGVSTARLTPSQESQWLKEALESLRRLDPKRAPAMQAGIRLRLPGIELPANISMGFWINLHEPGLERQQRKLYPDRSGTFDIDEVPLDRDHGARISVVPGRYELSVRQGSRSLSGDQNRELYRRLVLDLDALPKEVEIGETTLVLDIPSRLMHDIDLIAPAAAELVDLNRAVFRWSEVPGASYYRVLFAAVRIDDRGGTTLESGPHLKSTEARLKLSERDIPSWAKALMTRGRTMAWRVQAFDDQDRQIGISVEHERPLVIAEELGRE